MDGQVAIKQVLGMFSAKVRDSDSNAEKVRASEKHPLEWFSHHGWTKHRHMTWWHPKRRTVIQPLKRWSKDERRRAAHERRESWRMVEWENSSPIKQADTKRLNFKMSRSTTNVSNLCDKKLLLPRGPLAGSCWGWPFLPRLQPVWALMESLHAGMPVPSCLTSGDANFGFAQALWVAWGWNGRRTGAKHGGGHLEWPHSCGHPLLTSNLLRWRWPSHGSLGERPSNF